MNSLVDNNFKNIDNFSYLALTKANQEVLSFPAIKCVFM